MRLFDTTFIIDLINNHPGAVNKTKQIEREPTLKGISVITAYEYLYGIHRIYTNNKIQDQNIKTAFKDLSFFHIFSLDYETIKVSARLQADLTSKRLMLGINDLYIAATAIQYHLILTTRDHDFSRIKKLKIDYYK